MIIALKERVWLILGLVLFIIMKMPALHFPFFWDESWSYAPAVQLMYKHGPSLLPGAINVAYSRGHPLLFYAFFASWMRIFGASYWSMHACALSISVTFVWTTFEIIRSLFRLRVANYWLLLFLPSVFFFVQSTMVLPEILLAQFVMLSLYAYVSHRHVLTTIALTLLMLTKETGMILGMVLGLHACLQLFSSSQQKKEKLLSLTSLLVPSIIVAIFFVIQKKTYGWVFFPDHTAYIKPDWIVIKGKFRFFFEILFKQQHRYVVYLLIGVLAVASSFTKRSIIQLIPVGLILATFVFIDDRLGWISRKVYVPGLAAYLIYLIYWYTKIDSAASSRKSRLILLSVTFCLASLTFYSFNFFSDRYLMIVISVFAMIAAYVLSLYSQATKWMTYLIVPVIALSACIPYIEKENSISDTRLSAFSAMKLEKDMVAFLEYHQLYDRHIWAPAFLQREHLLKPLSGFRSTIDSFVHVEETLSSSTQFVMFDNIEPDSSAIEQQLESEHFRIIYQKQYGHVKGSIYEKGASGIIYLDTLFSTGGSDLR